ncbi:MAG TPA: hypothetical protein VH414_17920 [Lichenihabitans sp.]|nr:hypothetical protein [Lichenihabitans sp.]
MPIAARHMLWSATLLAVACGGQARAADLFATLPGTWTGTGTVLKTDNTTESLRCKVKYSLTPSGTIMHQELLCAADSYRMDFVTDLVNQGGALAGTWKEKDRQAGGSVSGKIEGDAITTQITGNGFEASVVITVKGSKQTIALTSDSGSYAKSVTIALKAE